MRQLSLEQLDRRLTELRQVSPVLQPPDKGWIATIRKALRMSQAQLGKRMGLSQQAVAQLEQRETDGSITLNALSQAAQALGGSVAYGVVPFEPARKTLENRANQIARRMVTSVGHSMRLEDQETQSDAEARIDEIVQDLLASPRALWSYPDAE
jgi:predicted DNA-binding mobile mystery protein A